MNKIVKMAIFLVALTATSSFAGYGFRAGFGLYDYSSGDSEMDKYVKIGYGFGGGLVTIAPLTSILSFISELSFFYRKPMILSANEDGHKEEMYLTEIAMSVPLMFQLTLAEGIPYLAAGVQLDSPISPKITAKADGEEESMDANGRTSMDFGFVLGIGYFITQNVGVDARAVIGITPIFSRSLSTLD
ncbi:MAG: PorT family protein [Fibromonadales bacterium]|nr:PorT family protein [Fibromonadales bacterium]